MYEELVKLPNSILSWGSSLGDASREEWLWRNQKSPSSGNWHIQDEQRPVGMQQGQMYEDMFKGRETENELAVLVKLAFLKASFTVDNFFF